MRLLICDDDQIIQDQLHKMLNEFFSSQKLASPEIVSFDNGESLLADTGNKDVVFLDIEMPGISGILTGKKLKDENPNIIIFIVTSFSSYLDDAMSFNVFRYLSKPIDKQRLFRNLKDALLLYNTLNTSLPVETKNGVHLLLSSDIIYVEARDRKVIVHTPNAEYESNQKLSYWQKNLPPNCFFQSHRSFIVNLKYVTDFDHSLIYFSHQKETAYLTRRKYTSFKETFFRYIKNTQ